MKMKMMLSRLVLALALAVTFAVGTGAHAADKIHLKNGMVVEGTITQELDGFIWFRTRVGGVETEVIYKPSEIEKIVRDAPAPASEPAQPGRRPDRASSPREQPDAPSTGAIRAAVLSLGEGGDKDMVGMYMTAESIRRTIPELEKDGVELLVLKINSGGGALLEIQRLSDLIEYELKPKFKVVAWIDWAISAAAMTAHAVEEIYFMTDGEYGACTGWFGALQAVDGRDLEDVLYMMERISARGGYDPKIMRAMQILEPLSATQRDDGTWEFFQNEDGEVLLNQGTRVLTLRSDQAEMVGFSKGTADSLDELEQAMNMGEIEWVGEWRSGEMYPISKADEMLRQFRNQVAEDQRRTNEYFTRYQQSIAMAAGAPCDRRGAFIGQARRALDLMKRMVANNPNFALFVFNMTEEEFQEFVKQEEKRLRDLLC